ncbi:MAG: hypothetical protein LUD16_08065 [Lachnospiraceae bacterium]|nr:hypothetical protein [Lachnospiraceae bacterium]
MTFSNSSEQHRNEKTGAERQWRSFSTDRSGSGDVQVYLLKAVFSFRDGRVLIVQWTIV